MKKKPKKRNPIKTLKKKIHTAWSLRVRTRDNYTCQWHLMDGKISQNKYHQAHHIVSQGSSNAYGKYDVINGVTLCGNCHLVRLKDDVDGYIAFRTAYLAERDLTYLELKAMYMKVVKLKLDDYQYLLSKLEGKDGKDKNGRLA